MRRRLLNGALAAAFTFSFGVATAAAANICEREMASASSRHGIPLAVLYAVGLTESGRKNSLQPYAMNIDGKAFFGTSAAEAVNRFKLAKKQGARMIDIGCMQINHHYHNEHFASLDAMFEPHANVEYAARFLKSLREREGSWTMAVARYHAGPNNNPAQKRYVCTVINNMVATGFGEWTARAKNFCG